MRYHIKMPLGCFCHEELLIWQFNYKTFFLALYICICFFSVKSIADNVVVKFSPEKMRKAPKQRHLLNKTNSGNPQVCRMQPNCLKILWQYQATQQKTNNYLMSRRTNRCADWMSVHRTNDWQGKWKLRNTNWKSLKMKRKV